MIAIGQDAAAAEQLRTSLKDSLTMGGQMELVVRQGDPPDQVTGEQAGALYELLLLPVDEPSSTRPNRLDPLTANILERMNKLWATPVLLIKGEPRPVKRLLICTAAGEPGKGDVRVGGRLARQLGADVTLLYITKHGTEPPPLVRSHLALAAATLRALDVNNTTRIRVAQSPADGILAEAREGNYDVIVLGSHGPQARSIFGIDDVTLQVVSNADRPILIVPDESV